MTQRKALEIGTRERVPMPDLQKAWAARSRTVLWFTGMLCFAILLCLSVSAKLNAQTIAARDVVAPAAYASFDPVARGREFQIAVVMNIRKGYHVNARKPTLEYLIPTDLKLEVPAGFKAGEVSYPEGKLRTFAFSKSDPLNVYEGSVILRVPVTVAADAATGAQTIPLKLRYQACSNEVCLPPVTLNVTATVNVAASPSAAKPAHAEIFAKH
jgi:thiol:disulfide interchange protein DsbD